MGFRIVTPAEAIATLSERDRVFMRLGVLVMLAVENSIEHRDVMQEMEEAGYPKGQLTYELAFKLSRTLGERLIAAGLLEIDEDPLERIARDK